MVLINQNPVTLSAVKVYSSSEELLHFAQRDS
jgi:hypothetical protein